MLCSEQCCILYYTGSAVHCRLGPTSIGTLVLMVYNPSYGPCMVIGSKPLEQKENKLKDSFDAFDTEVWPG